MNVRRNVWAVIDPGSGGCRRSARSALAARTAGAMTRRLMLRRSRRAPLRVGKGGLVEFCIGSGGTVGERNRQLLHDTAASAAAREQARGTDIEQVDAALKLRTDTRGQRFAITIGATRYADRRAAADALSRWANDATLNQARPLG